MGRKSSKEAILDAAERVLRRQGLAATTVEAVAAEAGVSKGGLFYHFASKKDMLLQLLERYGEQFEKTRRDIYATLAEDEPNRLLKATIVASIKHPAKEHTNLSNILTLLDDMDLREKVAEMKLRSFKEISEGHPHPERVALAMLAADGLWVMDLFGVSMLSREFEETIIAELLRLIDVHAAPAAEGGGAPRAIGRPCHESLVETEKAGG